MCRWVTTWSFFEAEHPYNIAILLRTARVQRVYSVHVYNRTTGTPIFQWHTITMWESSLVSVVGLPARSKRLAWAFHKKWPTWTLQVRQSWTLAWNTPDIPKRLSEVILLIWTLPQHELYGYWLIPILSPLLVEFQYYFFTSPYSYHFISSLSLGWIMNLKYM